MYLNRCKTCQFVKGKTFYSISGSLNLTRSSASVLLTTNKHRTIQVRFRSPSAGEITSLKLAAIEPSAAFSRPLEASRGHFSLSAMSSMYGIQTQPESMAHIHGVCDPHMNSLSLQVGDDIEVKAIEFI